MTYYRGNEPIEVSKKRFAAKTVRDEHGCLIWQGKPSSAGYGHFGVNGEQDYAHRWAWFFHTGDWPQLFVCHSCDNPLCVEPKHLFLGDHQSNMLDAQIKSRMGRPHKLTAEKRAQILQEYKAGGIKQRDLAKKHGTTQSTVSEIIRGLHMHRNRQQDARG